MKIKNILLLQPDYAILGRRTWPLIPYNLCLLKACLKNEYTVRVVDLNLENNTIEKALDGFVPDCIGLTSFSTEYSDEIHWHIAIIRKLLPDVIIILGGAYATVQPEVAMQDSELNFCMLGEGEYRLPRFFECLNRNEDVHLLDGVAFRNKDTVIEINQPIGFINDLDNVPFPDYSDIDFFYYGNQKIKYAHTLLPRQFPFFITVSTRGCPFDCIFCAGRTLSGNKVRLRSAKNVLAEIKYMYQTYGIKEVIFLDDHFLHDRERALEIMQGIKDLGYNLTWKCVNETVFCLDEELLNLKKETGCYQITLSIESGVQSTLKNIIRKPVNLEQARKIVNHAKSIDMEVISNFVIGFPGETWDNIRTTFAYAESLDLDIANFHIATPLPKTRLMKICQEMGLIQGDGNSGYMVGVINTDEFTPQELAILRAYEWDRINFKTPEKIGKVAKIEGLSLQEVAQWRKSTRTSLGNISRAQK